MKYCSKCRHQMADDMLFCQKCGAKVEAAVKEERPAASHPVLENIPSTPTKQKAKNNNGARVLGIVALVLIVIIIIATIGSNGGNNNSDSTPSTSTNDPSSTPESNIVLDVEKYGNISAKELVVLLGQPNEISESTCQGAFNIPCTYYEYSNVDVLGEVSFVLVNDQVVRFTSYSDYPYKGKSEVLAQFGITTDDSCAVAADTNVALRYRCPSAKVDDFWINLIDGNSFGFLQITYDMEYYEEWYLPLSSSEEINYKSDAETTMKSLLTAPKTAKFPWYDWQYGKNLFYILVSSYVDSENAFGVEMRNTFTFVYSRLTGGIVLAIVNDEVVANNGYVAVDELIQQLYDEMKKVAASNSSTDLDKDIESTASTDETHNGTAFAPNIVVKDGLNITSVAAGLNYSVAVKNDGSVVAVGYSECGECNVGSWDNIISITSGGTHTVGLKNDGTVVAVGYNDFGQCKVSAWRDIVEVSASTFSTLGLKADGTVVIAGYDADIHGDIANWKDIVSISDGGNFCVGLQKDGGVAVSGLNWLGQYEASNWTNMVAVKTSSNHTVGLKADGTVVAIGNNDYGQCNTYGWTNIIAIAVGESHTIGIKEDGTVVAVGYNEYGQCNVSTWTDIISIDADLWHTVGLKADGTVIATGDNACEQCNVSEWRNIRTN